MTGTSVQGRIPNLLVFQVEVRYHKQAYLKLLISPPFTEKFKTQDLTEPTKIIMQEKCNFVLTVIPEAESWTHTREQRAVVSAGMFEPPNTKNMVY